MAESLSTFRRACSAAHSVSASVALALLLWSGLIVTAVGQQEIPGEALDALAQYQVLSAVELDARLTDLGYTPSGDLELWRGYPPVRKLESAFLAAEESASGGGQAFLALLSRALAQEYEGVRHEPALASYLSGDAPQAVAFASREPVPAQATVVDDRARKAIMTLAWYAGDSPSFGGTEGVLLWHFRIAEDRAYEILRTSATATEALNRAYAEVTDSLSTEVASQRLSTLIRDVESVYSAARDEEAFAPFRTARSGSDAVRTVRLSAAGAEEIAAADRTASVAARRATAAARYGRFLADNYGQAGTRAFGRMVSRSGGFGGVIFGAEVRDVMPPGNTIERAIWSPGLAEGWGRLLVTFSDATAGSYGPVRESDIRAARELAGVDGELLDPEEGVGLVSLHDGTPYWQLDARVVRNEGRHFEVIVHPALVDHPVGRSAAIVDALPVGDELVSLLDRHVPSSTGRIADMLDKLRSGGTWKFTDRPTWVGVSGSLVQVWTSPNRPSAGDNRFLSVRSFSGVDSYVQTWEFLGEAGEPVTFDLESSDFDATLSLAGPGLQSVLSDDDGGDGTDARLEVTPPRTAVYRVMVSSFGGGTGEYRLTATTNADPVAVETIALGDSATGSIGSNQRTRAWSFAGRRGEAVTFDLRSTEFDAYLRVAGPGLTEPLFDDDSGGGTNARVSFVLPQTGEYTVVASSFGDEGGGAFTLRVRGAAEDEVGLGQDSTLRSRVAELDTEGRVIELGATEGGVLRSERPEQAWEFTSEEGQTVTFELQSGDFDAYLLVAGPGLEVVLSDDDSGLGTDARVELVAPNGGTYKIVAGSFGGVGQGDYTLIARDGVETEPVEWPPTQGRSIGVDSTEGGVLTEADAWDLGPSLEAEDDFDALFGGIASASEDFERLNDFAQAFAVVRWVSGHGAEWIGWPATGTWTEEDSSEVRRHVPAWLAVTDSGLVDVSGRRGGDYLLDVLSEMAPKGVGTSGVVSSRTNREGYRWESGVGGLESLVEVWMMDVMDGMTLAARVSSDEVEALGLRIVGPGVYTTEIGFMENGEEVAVELEGVTGGLHYVVVEDLLGSVGGYELRVTTRD